MPRMVTVMVLPAGEGTPIKTVRIDGDDYLQLNRLVQGNLGTCPLPPSWRARRWYAFCDDDGAIRDPRPEQNRWAIHLGHPFLYGPVVIVRNDDLGETRSLTRADVADLEMRFAMEPSVEASQMAYYELNFWKAHPAGVSVYNFETNSWE